MSVFAASISKLASDAVHLRLWMQSLQYYAVQALRGDATMSYVRNMIETDKPGATVTSDRTRHSNNGSEIRNHVSDIRREAAALPRRVSITLTGETLANALALAEQHHITPGDVARRGIAVLKLLTDEQEKGSILRIQSPTGETDRIRIVFT
jgi:hypothetical protein